VDGKPETAADKRFFDLRASGYTGPINEDGRKLPLSLRGLRDVVLAGDPGCVCDPELFTGPAGVEAEDEPPEDRAARITVAREVCASCPVRLGCLAYALRTRPAAGVWAGFTSDEIAALVAAANRPARPRRHTALRPVSTASATVGEVA